MPKKSPKGVDNPTKDYAIGSHHLPGLAKLVEEMGETAQIVGKIQGLGHMGRHWDGKLLQEELEDEIADTKAAQDFFIKVNGLRKKRINKRVKQKVATFERWHKNIQEGRLPTDDGEVK